MSTSGLHLELRIDDEVRQSARVNTMSMLRGLLDDLRGWAPLAAGDVVFTDALRCGRLHPGQAVVALRTPRMPFCRV
ncbi:MAG: hypothetical protein CM15mP128_4920 [Methanobacteriota archaeon]|nr:MAG: hypothetical protein CM15mP128_4920 [Euryarchaeota archaeon]